LYHYIIPHHIANSASSISQHNRAF
jgi:hypothetical protein